MSPSVEGFMDGKEQEFPCETCDAVLKTTVGEARRAEQLECPNGHPIPHDREAFDASIKSAEERVANVMNRFTF